MNTQMILNELSLIFQEILKRDNIVLTSETTAQDVEGWNSLTNMLRHVIHIFEFCHTVCMYLPFVLHTST